MFSLEYISQFWVLYSCYFIQGCLLTLPDIALRLFLSEYIHLSTSQVQLIYGFMLIPWLCKPLYGFISDSFPIFNYRRSPYLFICYFFTSLCWIGLAFLGKYSQYINNNNHIYLENSSSYNNQLLFIQILSIIGLYGESLFICICGVLIDSIIVEYVREYELDNSNLGKLQSISTIWKLLGTLISSLLSGYLLDILSISQLFIITGALPYIAIVSILFLNEKQCNNEYLYYNNHKILSGLYKLKNTIKLVYSHLFYDSKLWKCALFILIISIIPSAYTPYYYYLYYEIGITTNEFGIQMFLITLTGIFGTLFYSLFLRQQNIRMLFVITILVGFFIRLTPEILILGYNTYFKIPDVIFAISDSTIISIISQISLMPLLVLGASICPKGIEGTLYAFLMSLTEIGSIIGDIIGTCLTSLLHVDYDDFSNLWLLVLLCNICSLIPILFICLIPSKLQSIEIQDNNDNNYNDNNYNNESNYNNNEIYIELDNNVKDKS